MRQPTFLEKLHEEHKSVTLEINSLNEKLFALEKAIYSYSNGSHSRNISTYPVEETWEKKILFCLKVLNKPGTANEIAQFLHQYEKTVDLAKLKTMSAQYCCNLAKKGKVNANKTWHKNIYSL